ncbi:3-keto-5-aminohexanoate cleavage protein [Rhodobacterales bacterium HKCCSP123]|nr:3-keto-5-aminohexanoate cleavage protein [Rhodobacterales bacterium HKCCSP123]
MTSRLARLPRIMLAPNGARRGRQDHPALPLTIAETVEAAHMAHEEGAEALHAHVRDAEGRHSLDAGLYRELIAEMRCAVPDMPVQITTEAAGIFAPDVQRQVVRDVHPEGASVALREIWPGDGPDAEARRFYHWAAEAGIPLQHILFDTRDAARFVDLVAVGDIPGPLHCIFVLGSYTPPRAAEPGDLDPFLAALAPLGPSIDWAVCAFGRNEAQCLKRASARGGKLRIGFENNIHGPDGTLATDNAAQVRRLRQMLGEAGGGDPS